MVAPARRPTVKDVARVAGVSASTVSNVLHDHPYVTEEKRRRVEDAIRQLGYAPSLVSRQLRAGRSQVLALAVPDITSPYFAHLAHVVMTEAHRRSITLFIDETGGSAALERTIAGGYPSRGVTGVLFCPVATSPAELERLKSNVPTVLLGEYVPGGSFDHIAIDSRGSAVEATEHLLSLGRRRLAFAGMRLGRRAGPAYERLEGVRSALRTRGLELDDDLVFDVAEHSREEGHRVARELVERRSPCDAPACDALVCAADLLGVGATAAFRQAGVAVPGDVALLGWDDAPEVRYTVPPLTSIAHDMEGLAGRAIDAILARQADPARPVEHTVVQHRLMVRESTGPGA
ncbi:LacI family transcriptional regulator [Streptomyces olivaceus]|uniref:LacI family DNA-binding transcriptional regulator n=1 Tax=Streptomyces olivaceus TaxID=47716 RepID=UPI001CCB1D57|nr:LacI family DNA-binding transcriptional regulator [Streptomyces olivaceus]MBZ6174700.1 LacI family transcriptional regulator [Streptomyces olivaceus]MBZ6181006.1 LacI family transcriptional regulator [Streptomyces olivaceus]MBZ6256389.1 LacI family transcriptional regulator [Streptomyces olivaceus]